MRLGKVWGRHQIQKVIIASEVLYFLKYTFLKEAFGPLIVTSCETRSVGSRRIPSSPFKLSLQVTTSPFKCTDCWPVKECRDSVYLLSLIQGNTVSFLPHWTAEDEEISVLWMVILSVCDWGMFLSRSFWVSIHCFQLELFIYYLKYRRKKKKSILLTFQQENRTRPHYWILFNCSLQLLQPRLSSALCPPQRANPLSSFVHFQNGLFSINYVTVLSVSVKQVLNCE